VLHASDLQAERLARVNPQAACFYALCVTFHRENDVADADFWAPLRRPAGLGLNFSSCTPALSAGCASISEIPVSAVETLPAQAILRISFEATVPLKLHKNARAPQALRSIVR